MHRSNLQLNCSYSFYDWSGHQGALIRWQWSWRHGPTLLGFSDLHPLTAFGDPPLSEHLRLLSDGKKTPLVYQSAQLAWHDAWARRRRHSLFRALALPTTHFLTQTDCLSQDWPRILSGDYRVVKIKCRNNWKNLAQQLNSWPESLPIEFRWRLDFNQSLTCNEYQQFLTSLEPNVLTRIEFVEDPYPLAGSSQAQLTAMDWNTSWPLQAQYPYCLVIKPARQNPMSLWRQYQPKKIVFTHCQDHVLGQASALFAAATFYRRHPALSNCGGFASNDWDDEGWRRYWPRPSRRLSPPPGTGLGFDELLAQTKWKPL